MATEKGLYAQVFMLRRKYLKITGKNKNKMKLNPSSKASLQDHSVGLTLIFITFKKISAHLNLISTGKSIKGMTKHKIQID